MEASVETVMEVVIEVVVAAECEDASCKEARRTPTVPRIAVPRITVAAFPLGWLMISVPLRALLLKFLLYQLHKTLGLLILGLTLVRLLIRARRGRPEWDDGLPHWQPRIAGSMHGLLYALLLATPVPGYLCAATAPRPGAHPVLWVIPVPHLVGPDPGWFSALRLLHRGFAVTLAFVGCGHAMAAVHNHRRGRRSLAMMWQG